MMLDSEFSEEQQEKLNSCARRGYNSKEQIVMIVELATTLAAWGWDTVEVLEEFKRGRH